MKIQNIIDFIDLYKCKGFTKFDEMKKSEKRLIVFLILCWLGISVIGISKVI